jgi:uncharacterized protein (TIGR00251 family)
MLTIQPHPEGSLLSVRAQPGARKNAVTGEHAGALKVSVTAPPEDGKANAAIVELLQGFLGLKRSQVELAGGATSRSKQILIRGCDPETLQALIASKRSDS